MLDYAIGYTDAVEVFTDSIETCELKDECINRADGCRPCKHIGRILYRIAYGLDHAEVTNEKLKQIEEILK